MNIQLKPCHSSLLCDASCKQANQIPDDEVEKLNIITTSVGWIEDISSEPLDVFQDSFGIYKEILQKYRSLLITYFRSLFLVN